MRQHLPSLLTVILMTFSGTAFSDESAELAKVLSNLLSRVSSESGSTISFKDGFVTSGGKRVKIVPVSENALESNGKFLSAARFEISVDGASRPEFTFGSIGVGDSPTDATETAVVEWYASAGEALLSALAGQSTDTRTSEFLIYPGLMGVRGDKPSGWIDGTPEMNRRIVVVLTRHLALNDKAVKSVDLKMAVNPDGSLDGQCFINGRESKDALTDLKGMPWPQGGGSYMFKQTYIIVPVGGEQSDGVERSSADAPDRRSPER